MKGQANTKIAHVSTWLLGVQMEMSPKLVYRFTTILPIKIFIAPFFYNNDLRIHKEIYRIKNSYNSLVKRTQVFEMPLFQTSWKATGLKTVWHQYLSKDVKSIKMGLRFPSQKFTSMASWFPIMMPTSFKGLSFQQIRHGNYESHKPKKIWTSGEELT